MSRRYVEFRCSSDVSAEITTGVLENREHLIVPVVMLIGDTVIQASNAPTPEFIPADVIESSLITAWNGRPVTDGHPKRKNRAVSANDPEMLSAYRMGVLFNTRFEDNKLKTSAWIDPERARELGGDAQLAVDKLTSGESIDVSVGVIVETEERSGISPDGTKYGAVWIEIDGDHLAFLPSSEGACNQSMGCGAPRIAQSIREENHMAVASATQTPASVPVAVDPVVQLSERKDFFSRLLSKFRPAMIFDDGQGDDELREILMTALKKVEPALDWICCVYPSSNAVIYMTIVTTLGSYEWIFKYWRRTYELSADGKSATLNNDAIEIRPKRVWETVDDSVTISEQDVETAEGHVRQGELRAASASCSCQDQTRNANVNVNATDDETRGANMATVEVNAAAERKDTIDSLISTGRFAESDRKVLSEMPEDGWKMLLRFKKEEPATAAAATVPATLTMDQALAALPELASIVNTHRAAQNARKTDLVSKLAALGKIPEDKLATKSLEALEEMAVLAGVDSPPSPVDYSVRGLPSNPSVRQFEMRKLKDPWQLEKKQTAPAAANGTN